MSDPIKHECGIAVVRSLKTLDYYQQKYDTPLYAFNKLFLLMEKQHNRGQDGAGIGAVKLAMPAGSPYMFRERSIHSKALDKIFKKLLAEYHDKVTKGEVFPEFPETIKNNFDYAAELLMGHLRYGTSGEYSESSCHPYFRRSNWPTKSLMLAGNFNITNSDQLNKNLIARGQHPIFETDTQTILEEIGFHLDQEHDRLYLEGKGNDLNGPSLADFISDNLDPLRILREAAKSWDGGYTLAGMIGNGDSFVLRDPNGIRPCFYFKDKEFVAFASERAPLMTIFDKSYEEIKEVEPGHVIIMKKDGSIKNKVFHKAGEKKACSFERIYFSRGNDPEIYRERKALGAALAPEVLKSIDHDLENSVFSYIPNTSEIGYYGMMDELRRMRRKEVKVSIKEAVEKGELTDKLLNDLIMKNWPRGERIANKDVKLRTFIAKESGRAQMVSHVYDITYGVVKEKDNLVCVDDSIVRGTTLEKSVLKILSKTNPKKIVIASTAPQIRYPDCYGIDMSELGKFIAFRATIALLNEQGASGLIQEVYQDCCKQVGLPNNKLENHVKRLYDNFTAGQISEKVAELVYPQDTDWNGELEVIFQSIKKLHKSLPLTAGDWYFTGDYPTAGGYYVLNSAFINYYENKSGRSY